MNIQKARILAVFILLIILISKQFHSLYYFSIMLISLEYLNHNKDYLSHYNFKRLNTIFIGYVLFICAERGRLFLFSILIEFIINSIEHLLFGFIICMKFGIYYSLLKKKTKLEKLTLILIAVVFNIFGFLNEFFQNWYKHKILSQFNFDSKKDILMNIIGSILFVVFYQKINKSIQNQNTENS